MLGNRSGLSPSHTTIFPRVDLAFCPYWFVQQKISRHCKVASSRDLTPSTAAFLSACNRLAAIEKVLITHAHLDHVAALAFMADSLLRVRTRPIEVWSIRPVILQLRAHVFNGTIWPDFTRLPSPRNPILSFHEIREGQQQRIGKHEVLAVRVHHTVEAAGYLVSDGKASIIFGGDTGPTAELWEVANRAAGLQAIIVEASYPNRLEDLAGVSGHLTPNTLSAELKKLKVNAQIYAQHIKPQCARDVLRELAALADPPVTPMEQGKEYVFVAP